MILFSLIVFMFEIPLNYFLQDRYSHSTYDRLFHQDFGYNNKLHRCDREHAKSRGLTVNEEASVLSLFHTSLNYSVHVLHIHPSKYTMHCLEEILKYDIPICLCSTSLLNTTTLTMGWGLLLMILILWNSLCSDFFLSNNPIRSQLYTCHNSSVVVAWAKLWPDDLIIISLATYFFIWFKFWAHNPLWNVSPYNLESHSHFCVNCFRRLPNLCPCWHLPITASVSAISLTPLTAKMFALDTSNQNSTAETFSTLSHQRDSENCEHSASFDVIWGYLTNSRSCYNNVVW